MKRWYLPPSMMSASVMSFVRMSMPPLPSTSQPSVFQGLSSQNRTVALDQRRTMVSS